MAILTIIYAGVWGLIWFCSGASVVAALTIQAPQLKPALEPFRQMYDLLHKEVPAYLAVEVSNYVLMLVLSVLLLIAAIGLLRMKSWAWGITVFSAAATVLVHAAHGVYQWIYVNPVMARWTEELFHKNPPPPGTPDFSGLANNPVIKALSTAVALTLNIGFPIALLIIMFLPQVRAAFARSPLVLDATKPDDTQPSR